MSSSPESHVSKTTYRADWFHRLAWMGRLLPRFLSRNIAAWIGYLYAWFHPRKTAVVTRNLSLLGQGDRKITGQVYAEFGKVMADYFYLARRPISRAAGLVDEHHGFEHLEAAHRAGHGALLLTPHLSFFELGGLFMQKFNYPMIALTAPEPSPALTDWRAAYRLRWGVETQVVGNDGLQFPAIVKSLAAGKFVAALFDRPHPSQSFPAQLPHGVLPCSTGVLLLALLARCPAIPVTVVAKPNGRYRLEVLEPILVTRRGSSAETLQYYTQVLVDALLPTIAAHPQQWFQFAPLD